MGVEETPRISRSLAVVYLARGSDSAPLTRFHRFLGSYFRFPAAAEHDLFIIFKGFDDRAGLERLGKFSRASVTCLLQPMTTILILGLIALPLNTFTTI